jgi:hypothetical protein
MRMQHSNGTRENWNVSKTRRRYLKRHVPNEVPISQTVASNRQTFGRRHLALREAGRATARGRTAGEECARRDPGVVPVAPLQLLQGTPGVRS